MNYSFKYIYTLLISLMILLISAPLLAQETVHETGAEGADPLVGNIIPPSPNAASLGKYGDMPVNLNKGLPQIDIPLHQVRGRNLSLPVSISYHASGIKVAEIASWVGMNWSLNAGGVITRSVRGIADDINQGGTIRSAPELKKGYFASLEEYDPSASLDNQFPDRKTPCILPPNGVFVKRILAGVREMQPDIYNFNFMGYSGKLYLRKENGEFKAYTQPYQDLDFKITARTDTLNDNFKNGMIWEWEITTEDGTKFIFGGDEGVEMSTSTSVTYEYDKNIANPSFSSPMEGGAEAPIPFPSSWYLRKIISTLGEEMTLHYRKEEVTYESSASQTDFARLPNVYNPNVFPDRDASLNINIVTNRTLLLDRIESVFETVTFLRDDTLREDLAGASRLKNIEVESKIGKAQLFKDVIFNYDYYVSTQSCPTTFLPQTVLPQVHANLDVGDTRKRLKLLDVSILGTDPNAQPQRFKFEYNTDPVPPRCSYAQDHMGYYNGKDNNTSLLPQDSDFQGTLYFGDRSFNDTTISNGILTKIIYPTGGYSEFTYDARISTDLVPAETFQRNIVRYQDTLQVNTVSPVHVDTTGNLYYDEVTFELTEDSEVRFFANNFPGEEEEGSGFEEVEGFEGEVYTTPIDGGGVIVPGLVQLTSESGELIAAWGQFGPNYTNDIQDLINGYTDYNGAVEVPIEVLNQNYIYKLPPGKYTLSAFNEYGNEGAESLGFVYYNPKTEQVSLLSTPTGYSSLIRPLRVTSIKDSDGKGLSTPKTRYFVYENMHTFPVPSYTHIETQYAVAKITVEQGLYPETCSFAMNYKIRRAFNPAVLGSFAGGASFGKVTTLLEENGQEGKMISTFSFVQDQGLNRNYPFVYPSDLSWRSGLPLGQYVYDAQGNLRSESHTTYEFQALDTLKGFMGEYTRNGSNAGTEGEIFAGCSGIEDTLQTGNYFTAVEITCKAYRFQEFRLYSEWVKKTSDISITYDDNGNPMTDTTYYYYDPLVSHTQVIGTRKRLSDNSYLLTKNTYPLDYFEFNRNSDLSSSTQLHAMQKMLDRHIINPVIEQTSWRETDAGSELLGGQINYFHLKDNNILPLGTAVLETQAPVAENNFQVSQMNRFSNPVSFEVDNRYQTKLTILNQDSVGNILAYQNTDDIPNAFIWGYQNSLPIARVVNASLEDIAYTSFEEDTSDAWYVPAGGTLLAGDFYTTSAKTGSQALQTAKSLRKDIPNAGTYILSYWLKSGAPEVRVSGNLINNPINAGTENDWTLYIYKLDVNAGDYVEITGKSAVLDELRLHPEGAEMMTYTYDPPNGLTSVTDVNQKSLHYEYDDQRRLLRTRDQDNHIINVYEYHYRQD